MDTSIHISDRDSPKCKHRPFWGDASAPPRCTRLQTTKTVSLLWGTLCINNNHNNNNNNGNNRSNSNNSSSNNNTTTRQQLPQQQQRQQQRQQQQQQQQHRNNYSLWASANWTWVRKTISQDPSGQHCRPCGLLSPRSLRGVGVDAVGEERGPGLHQLLAEGGTRTVGRGHPLGAFRTRWAKIGGPRAVKRGRPSMTVPGRPCRTRARCVRVCRHSGIQVNERSRPRPQKWSTE